ncbi:glycosyltransferase [Candidatus Bathyarchaeota archaeon]|nr:glycosyltransferase [Candidatus Bathyarchaeota archaeon]
MKICYISTYHPQHCGIADYTGNLCKALLEGTEDTSITVAAEYGSSRFETERFTCIPCFRRGESYAGNILRVIYKVRPDIVHIQHDYSIYGLNGEFLNFLERLKVRKVVTMHEVHTPETPEKISYGIENLSGNHKRLADLSDMLIVHSGGMSLWLRNYDIDDGKITIIPHGTPNIPVREPSIAKRSLGFSESDKIILSFGFIRYFKNDHLLIRAFKDVTGHVSNVKLVLAGGLHPYSSRMDIEEVSRRRVLVESLGLNEHVKLIEKYVPPEDVPILLTSADVFVFLHDKPFMEVSGALHSAFGACKPIIATSVPRFVEVGEVSPHTLIKPSDREGLVKILIKILTDEEFADDCKRRVARYAALTSWSRVAMQHYSLYKQLSNS